MPVEITNVTESQEAPEVENILWDKDGKLTLEGQVVSDFLSCVDYAPIFAMEGMENFIKRTEAFVTVDEASDELIEADEKTEGAELGFIETLDGETVAENIDVDDLCAMFEYFAHNVLPDATLEDKARKQLALQLLGEENLEEGPFKKGDFRKIQKRPGGHNAVARMLVAMMKKQAIQRAAGGPGTGYKKGDYQKHPSGYSPGTPSGIKKWRMYKKKASAKISQAAKKTKSAKVIAKFTGKPAGGKAKGGKSISASDTSADAKPKVYETHLNGPALAGKMGSIMNRPAPDPMAPGANSPKPKAKPSDAPTA